MGDIISPEEFDKIYNKIVWIDKLKKELDIFKQPHRDFLFNKFLCDNTYKVYYENEEYYVLTDSYFNSLIDDDQIYNL
jgi:hypothetical protein